MKSSTKATFALNSEINLKDFVILVSQTRSFRSHTNKFIMLSVECLSFIKFGMIKCRILKKFMTSIRKYSKMIS